MEWNFSCPHVSHIFKSTTVFESNFIDFISAPCSTSKACMHIIADLLLENYPFKTKHVCLQLSNGEGKLIKSSMFNHDCTCPFIRYLLEFWPGKKQKVLYNLAYNYKCYLNPSFLSCRCSNCNCL